MDKHTDIVGIVGAGPVGLVLAARLADFGIRSVILEQAPHLLRKGSKACLIQGDALEVLDKSGCAATIAEEGIHWRIAHTYIRNTEQITQEYPERVGFGEFVNISQYRIEQVLVAHIEANPLAEIRWSHRVTGLEQKPDRVAVTVDTPTGEQILTFAYCVACDGVRSTLRDLTGVEFTGYTHRDRFLITDIKANIPLRKERHFHFDPHFNPGRQLVMHPQPDNIWRIDWQLAPEDDVEAEKNNGDLDKRIRKVIGDIPYQIEWMSTYRFHQRVVEKFRIDRLFYAGDAAHSLPPYGSRGMNSGIQDADNLAWKMAYVMRGLSTDALLDSYHVERYAAARENLRVTEATIKFMVPPTAFKRWTRNLILWLSERFKPMRKNVNHGKMAEPFTYTNSPIVGDHSAHPMVGRFMPDAGIFIDGQRSRLRQLFGHSFVCLVFGDETEVQQFSREARLANGTPGVTPARAAEQVTARGNVMVHAGVPVTVYAAFPKGGVRAALSAEVRVIEYDDILFFRSLYQNEAVCYVVRPDGHIAGVHGLGEARRMHEILAHYAGVQNLAAVRSVA